MKIIIYMVFHTYRYFSKSSSSMEDLDMDDHADGSRIIKRSPLWSYQALRIIDDLLVEEEKRAIEENPPIVCKRRKLNVILPMIRHETRAEIIDLTLSMSSLWSSIKKRRRTQNIQVRSNSWFSQFLL
jgi:hypothetical protein